ncbi:MAG: hypothetical protein WB607_30615 [Candidatus Acidiferrum sp.]
MTLLDCLHSQEQEFGPPKTVPEQHGTTQFSLKIPNPQPNPQFDMSCMSCAAFGSPRGFVAADLHANCFAYLEALPHLADRRTQQLM